MTLQKERERTEERTEERENEALDRIMKGNAFTDMVKFLGYTAVGFLFLVVVGFVALFAIGVLLAILSAVVA